MKYDDASWHYGGEFPEGHPQENGGVHIALFMKWCFINGWAGELHLNEEAEDTQKVINGTLSATDFFFKYCDGKLTDEDFNEKGNEIASLYLGSDGLYIEDYSGVIQHNIYEATEEEHDFNALMNVMNERLESGIFTLSARLLNEKKPWWKFW